MPSELVFHIPTQSCMADRNIVGSALLLTPIQMKDPQSARGISIGKCWSFLTQPGGPPAPQGRFTMQFGAQGVLYIARGTPHPITGPTVAAGIAIYTVGISGVAGAGLFVDPNLMGVLRNWISQKGPQPVVLKY
jgi:hypothetical protein